MLDAAVRRVPLSGGVERVSAPEGSTLAEFVALAFPLETHRRFVVAMIDGEEIPVEAWERIPRAGEHVQLAFRPGGKDFFRTILQIAVIAVAVWISGGGLGGVFGAGSWQAAVAAAGVSILGNLAINTLIPLPKPGTIEAPPPYYSISNARNASRPWGVAPMLFGRHRIVAPRMSEPVQDVIGGATYLRVALCLGLCPMQATDWKIGETALSAFSGVEMEVRLNETDPPHTLITGDPSQEAVGATLTHTDWTVRTTATDVDEIEVINDFPSGLGGVDSKNRKTARTVQLRIQYRPTGSSEDWSDWRPDVPQANAASAATGAPYRPEYFDLNEDLVGWQAELDAIGGVANGIYSVTRSDAGRAFRDSVRFAVPRGQYDVRQQRVAAVSVDPNVVDAVTWSILGSIKSQADPFPNRKLATACFRIKASDQLSNMVETLNCIASSLQPVFSAEALADPTIADGSEFTSVETSSNPAVLALLAMRGANTAYPKPDEEIDWPSFAEAAAKATLRGLTFNEYVETSIGRWEMVRRILAAMHARPVKHNGRVSVVVDDDKTGQAPAQEFSPRNVRNFRWRKTYPRLPHAIRTPFANAANGWQADEVTVYLPGQSAETATRYETVQMPGKTDADEIRTVVNQYARNAWFQTEAFDFEMDAEHLACKRGDYAVVHHFAMATGLGAARIRTRETSDGAVTAILLDAAVETPTGETLAVQWRTIVVDSGLARMEVLGEEVVTRDPANPKRFVFATPILIADAPVAAGEDYEGDVALVGIAGKVSYEVLVRDILPRPHLQAAISCVAYAGQRFVDAPDWPAHEPKVTLPFAPRPGAPVELETVARQLEIAVSFTQPALPRGLELVRFNTFLREHGSASDTWEPLGQLRADERIAVAPPGDPGASYDVQIVAVARRADGVLALSDPLVVSDIAAATAPAAPAGCSASFATRTSSGGAKQLVLTPVWTPNEDTGVLDTVVEQRISTGPDVWQEIGRGRAAAGKTEIHGLPVGRDYVLGFVNLSRRGAPSARTTIASISAPDTLVATGAIDVEPGGGLGDVLDDLAAADAALDAAVDAADARLDDAEDRLGLHGTAIGELETVTEGHATRISGLQAVSGRADASIVPNAAFGDYPNSTGLAAGWGVWNAPTAERTAGVVSPYSQFVEAAAGVPGGFARTLAAEPGLYAPEIAIKLDAGTLAGAGVLIQFLNGSDTVFHSESFVLASIPDVNGLVSTNNGSWRYFRPPPIEFPAGTVAITLYGINHYATFGSIAAMNQIHWAQLDVRPVSNADVRVGEAKASIVEIEDVQADHDSALAALDSRLDVTEDDVDGVTGDVATLNAANLISRMAAVDGGLVSARTLSQVRASADAARLELSSEFPDGMASLSASFTGVPSAMADLTGSAYSLQTVDGQNVIQVTGYAPVYAKQAIRVRPNRVWEIEAEVRQTVADPDAGQNRVWMFARCLGASYNNLGTALNNDAGADIATADGWVKRTWRFTNNSALSGEVETYDALSGVTFLRPWIQFNSISGAGTQQMRALRVRDITAEFGAAAANASVTDLEEAVADEVSARAAFQTTAEADIGALEATATTQGGAIADLNGGAAWIESVVSAGGGDLGAFRLRAGKAGSFIELISTVLRLANVSNGAVIEVMRAIGGEAFFSRPVSSDSGSRRVTIGPGYGVSGQEVVLWFGPVATAPSSQSRTNGYFALGTDGKVYYGSAELGTPIKLSVGSAINIIGSSGFSGTITVTPTGGSGSYDVRWTKEPYEAGQSATLTNALTTTVTVAASLSTGQDSTGRVRCDVKDSEGRTASITQAYNFSKTS